jgi:hypothetical protein
MDAQQKSTSKDQNQLPKPPFWFTLGLLHGSVLSPPLFNYFIDDLPQELRQLTGTETSVLFEIADDIAVIAKSLEEFLAILKACKDLSDARHFKFGPTNCEVIAPPSVHYTEIRQIKLYDKRLTISNNSNNLEQFSTTTDSTPPSTPTTPSKMHRFVLINYDQSDSTVTVLPPPQRYTPTKSSSGPSWSMG